MEDPSSVGLLDMQFKFPRVGLIFLMTHHGDVMMRSSLSAFYLIFSNLVSY